MMNIYHAGVIETGCYGVAIEADSYEQAYKMAKTLFANGATVNPTPKEEEKREMSFKNESLYESYEDEEEEIEDEEELEEDWF